MNEADHKLRLVKEVKLLGGMARRLEDKYALGLLDLVIKLPDQPMLWAEGKLIDGNLFAPTARQYLEGEDWLKAGVEVLLIGWDRSAMYISPWVKQADKRQCWIAAGTNYASSLQGYMPHAQETAGTRS